MVSQGLLVASGHGVCPVCGKQGIVATCEGVSCCEWCAIEESRRRDGEKDVVVVE